MDSIGEVTINVDCKLNVTDDTAETCLKLVEIYLNNNDHLFIDKGKRDDGSIVLQFVNKEFSR